MTEEGYQRLRIFCCAGHPPRTANEADSICEKIPSSVLPRYLMRTPSKVIIIVIYIIYFAVAIKGAFNIKTGLKLENVVPETSYLSSYYNTKKQYFSSQGPWIMFVIEETVPYQFEDVQKEIAGVIDKAQKASFVDPYPDANSIHQTRYLDPTFHISWLRHYVEFSHNQSKKDHSENYNMPGLDTFLKMYPMYQNDIVVDETTGLVVASRFYVASKNFDHSEIEGDMMECMRQIANDSSLNMVAFSPEFIYYEHYVSILKNTLLSVGVAIIAMLFIALMFIPHPISVTCVTLSMISIVLGMFGFMHYWGLALSAITTVQIILSVGFCVDFTIHISHAFMTATGKNRNERVMTALEKVGVPILNGALSSILGILMLAFASSYILNSFFKTMLLVIVLGLAHALLFLPVMLSFVGPRRTSRPKVFIPISTVARWPTSEEAQAKQKEHRDSRESRQRMTSTCSSVQQSEYGFMLSDYGKKRRSSMIKTRADQQCSLDSSGSPQRDMPGQLVSTDHEPGHRRDSRKILIPQRSTQSADAAETLEMIPLHRISLPEEDTNTGSDPLDLDFLAVPRGAPPRQHSADSTDSHNSVGENQTRCSTRSMPSMGAFHIANIVMNTLTDDKDKPKRIHTSLT